MLSIFNLSGGTAQSGRSHCSIQAEPLLNFAGRADFAERRTHLSNVCVVTSFYQSLQAMSSFMHFPICATYCTLSCATRMSSSRQKINLCKSRNPKPPIEFLMVWEFCFRLLQYKEFTPSTRIAVFTNLEGNPVQSKYLHRISL